MAAVTPVDPAVTATKKVEKAGAFYHVGLLPHPGRTALPLPGPDGKGFNRDACDAGSFWNRSATVNGKPYEEFKVFVSKCRKWLALDVGGVHFPATSQHVETSADEVNRTTYAGSVLWLTPDKLKALVLATKRHFIRYPNGVDSIDDQDGYTKATLHSMNDGAKPDGWTDAEWSDFKRTNQGKYQTEVEFNADTDAPVADFVYITKLENVGKVSMKDYNKDPKRYHAQMVRPMNMDFFTDPPKSVTEVYPGA